ncbi:MAG: hypothetical protein R6U95_07550 [Bacteroidales bacterium]
MSYLSSFAYPFPNTHRPTGTSLKGGIARCNVSTHFSHALPEHKAYQSRWDGMIINTCSMTLLYSSQNFTAERAIKT